MKIELTATEILSWPFYVDASGHAKVSFLGVGVVRSRLVVWATSGRLLDARTEVVHHVNEDKLDDRPENPVVLTRSDHMKLHPNPWFGPGWPKGRKRSETFKKNLSEAKKGIPQPWLSEDKERNQKISAFRKTYRYSAEAKQKISEGLKRHFAEKRATALLEQWPTPKIEQ